MAAKACSPDGLPARTGVRDTAIAICYSRALSGIWMHGCHALQPRRVRIYLLVGVGSAFFVEGGAAAASWPPAGRFRSIPACLWVVPRYVPAWVAAGSIAATRNLMAAAASANCAVLVRHACDVPVRASLHVG